MQFRKGHADVCGAVHFLQEVGKRIRPVEGIGNIAVIGVVENDETAVYLNDQIVVEVGTYLVKGKGNDIVGRLRAVKVDRDDVQVWVKLQVV